MNILFLGDSLIEYFDWQQRFPEQRITNLGVSGEPVEGMLSRVAGIAVNYPSTDVIFLMTGINNVAMEDYEFPDAYRKIIVQLRTGIPEAAIYGMSILPALAFFISNDVIRKVNLNLRKIIEASGAEYLDINSMFLDAEGRAVREYFLDDGVHLSDKGYDLWSGALERIIKDMAHEREAG